MRRGSAVYQAEASGSYVPWKLPESAVPQFTMLFRGVGLRGGGAGEP